MTTISHERHERTAPAILMGLIALALVFWLGTQITPHLSVSVIGLVVIFNLLVVIAFVFSGVVKSFARLKLPLLVLLGGTSGVILSVLAGSMAQLGVVLLGAVAISSAAGLLVQLGWLNFAKQQTILALAALVFSLLGVLLVYRSGWETLVIVWTLAAVACFFALVHILLYGLKHNEKRPVIDGIGNLFLLNIGIMVNLILMLQAVFSV